MSRRVKSEAAKRSALKKRSAPQGVGFSLTLIIGLVLLIEAAFINLIPLAVRYFVDKAVPSKDLGAIYPVIYVLFGGVALAALAGLIRDFIVAGAVSRQLSRLRRRVFDRLQQTPLLPDPSEDGPELVGQFAEDCSELELAWRAAVPRGLLPGITALISSVLLLILEWHAGFIALFIWPWVLMAPRAMAVREEKAETARETDEERLRSAMEDNLTAQPAIRAFSLEQTAGAAFRKRNEVLLRSASGAGSAEAIAERFTWAGLFTLQIVVFSLGMQLAAAKQATGGTIVAQQMLIMILGQSLMLLSRYLRDREPAQEAWKRIEELIATPTGPEDKRDARVLPPLETEIGLSNVNFTYGAGAVQQLSFITARIPKGASVAFVGPSGCGKSTLVNLLLRFYDPTDGRITIDGHDLKSVTKASLRSRIGAVLQENPVFNMTIAENLRIGKPDASHEAMIEASKAVGLHEQIMTLPQGYDSPAGTGGVAFPPPLVKRLAIARAILRNPDILILDEVTSDLEAADELAVHASLEKLREGRTVISLSHRLATTANADQIFMMEEGKIIEHGSHFELMALGGTYAQLWQKQAGFQFSADGRHVDVAAVRLKSFPILEQLSEDKLAEIAPYFATETFQPGREIVRQDDPGDKFYIIARGKVEVWRTDERNGHYTMMAVLGEGDFFGEITLITGFPRTATVKALTLCTCISLERGQFNRMIERSPELLKELSEVAVKRLRESVRVSASIQ